jgi:hypothetical protein
MGELLARKEQMKNSCSMLWRVPEVKRLGYKLRKINVISTLRHIGKYMYQLL